MIIIPFFIFSVLTFSVFTKVNAYDSFIKGSKEGLELAVKLFPYILSMVLAMNIFRSSMILEDILNPSYSKIPLELLIQGLTRPISGNASLTEMLRIFDKYGVDSKIGIASSIIQGSSDTTLYVMMLYFGVTDVKKIRYCLFLCLLADTLGFILTVYYF